MSTPLHLDELLTRLGACEPLVLPTPRAAAALRAAFDAQQRNASRAAWEPAPVLAWAQYLSGLWSELVVSGHEPRLLLNPAQEHALWREIVAETPATLGSPDALADLAQSAWQLAAQYDALPRLRATANTHDARIFADWAATFTRRCQQRAYLSTALLEAALAEHLLQHTLPPPPTLTLVGFIDRTPSQQALVTAFDQAGTRLAEHTVVSAHAQPTRSMTTAVSEREELALAARWVHAQLEAEPFARVAILVPDLAEVRADLQDALTEALAPALHAIDADLAAMPWEFATGAPLASLAPIAEALRLAHWAAHALSLDAVTALLLSPYLAHTADEPDRSAAARFDATILRRAPMLRDELKLGWLLNLAAQQRSPGANPNAALQPTILAALADLQTLLQRNDLQRPRSYADWTEFVSHLLRSAQWPGTRTLDATEFEATRAWDSLLDNLATLDFAGRRVHYATFLAELARQAHATPFIPPATHAPVQIMTPAASVGCTFDAVLFLRATDAHWPSPERTHPLLAWPLQRQLAMPGADAAHNAARARDFTVDLLQRSGNILFTHAAEDANGHLRPSTLLATLNLADLPPDQPAPTPAPIALEAFADAAPLPALGAREVPGGARVLTLQAACGFRAFATLRLRATEPEAPELGLDAGESGSLLHRALQTFWSRIRTQQALRDLDPSERIRILAESIDTAIPRRIRPDGSWDNAYLALQKERLLAVLTPWLDEELKRGPFEVLAMEAAGQIDVGPLTLDVRLDRIDRIARSNTCADDAMPAAAASDGFFLVDYKSGLSGHPRDWETDRPSDPQLPLYALLHEPAELRGLAFAKVRAGDAMRWHGIQAEDGLLPSSRSNPIVELEYLLHDWRAHLTHLAEDFAAGDARVRPRDHTKDCVLCDQRLLCRVDFTTLTGPQTERSEDDEAEDADRG